MPKKKTCPNCGSKMEGPKYECRKAGDKEVWYALYTCVCKQPLMRKLKPYEVKRIKKSYLPTMKDAEEERRMVLTPKGRKIADEDIMAGHTHRKDRDSGPLVGDDMPTELDLLKKKMQDCSEVYKVEVKKPREEGHLPMVRELHITPEDRGPYFEVEAILGEYPTKFEPISELNLILVGEYQIVVMIGTPAHLTHP